MLKIFTIYSMVLMILSMVISVYKVIKSNETEERIINFVSLILYCPMVYVLIEILKML